MFSVIIPLYNKAEYVTKAIRSVLDQTFRDLELIIVDDGSTDNSLEIVRQFDDARIRIINQENAGVSTARNNGVKAANNEYVSFLDADDWWSLNYLYEMHKLIQAYPDAGLWSSRYYKVKRGEEIEANIGLEAGFLAGYINYIETYAKTMWMPVYPPTVVLSKSIFSEFKGFKPQLKIGEDFDLWIRIAMKYKIAYLNKPLVYYNQDVDLNNRAVGGDKVWKPENHFIFQLEYLKYEEIKNPTLSKLLDNQRVRTLIKHRINNAYSNEANQILKQVDWSNQSLYYKFIYKSPWRIVKYFFKLKQIGSQIKDLIRKKTNIIL